MVIINPVSYDESVTLPSRDYINVDRKYEDYNYRNR